MKTKLLIIGLISFSISIFCQNSFDPKVVVFSPRIIITEAGINKEIDFFDHYMISNRRNHYIEKKDSLIDALLKKDSIKANEKEHLKNIIEFAPHWSFNTNLVHRYVESMQSILNITFDNHLVIANSDKSILDSAALKEYTVKNGIDYIVNIDTIFISRDRKGILIRPVLSLYDKKLNQHIDFQSTSTQRFNSQYITIKKKHLLFTQKTTKYLFYGDIESYSDLFKYIQNNGDSTKRKEINDSQELEQNRLKILDGLFQTGKNIGSDFLQKKDSILSTPTSTIYTALSSKDKNKYIAFFVRKQEYKFQYMSGIQDAVSIIYCKKENQNWEYRYLVKWIMSFKEISQEEKVRNEFMKLIDMNFFKENSFELNDEFWEKEQFLKHYIKN